MEFSKINHDLRLTKPKEQLILIGVVLFIIVLLFRPVFFNREVSILGTVSSQLFSGPELFNLSYYEDILGQNVRVNDQPLLFIFINLLLLLFGNNSLPFVLLGLLVYIGSLTLVYHLYLLKNDKRQVKKTAFYFIAFLLPVFFQPLFFDIASGLILINIPYLYCLIRSLENETENHFSRFSMWIFVFSSLIIGFSIVFTLLLGYIYIGFRYIRSFGFNYTSKMISVQIAIVLFPYALFFIHVFLLRINFIIFFALSMAFYLILTSMLQSALIDEKGRIPARKILNEIHNNLILIIISFTFNFLLTDLSSTAIRNVDYFFLLNGNFTFIISTLTFFVNKNLFFFGLFTIVSLIGLIKIFKDENSKNIVVLMVVSAFIIIFNLFSISEIFNPRILLFAPFLYIFAIGLSEVIEERKIIEIKDNFEVIAVSVPLFLITAVFLLLPHLDQFLLNNFSSLPEILFQILLMAGLYWGFLFIRSFFIKKHDLFVLFILFFASYYLTMNYLPFLTGISLEKLLILAIIFTILMYSFNYFKSKQKMPIFFVLLLCIHIGSLPMQKNLTQPVFTLDDVASIIIDKTGGNYNHTFWVDTDAELRLALHYFLPMGLPSNEQNYGLFPLTLNQTEELTQLQHIPRFFLVEMTKLTNLHLFGTTEWLKANFSSFTVSLGSFKTISHSDLVFFY